VNQQLATMAPTIFVVPGIYEGPSVFNPLKEKLEAKGYKVHVTRLLSTGTTSPGNKSMLDDAAFIGKELLQVAFWALWE
jgi:hypothetical protein